MGWLVDKQRPYQSNLYFIPEFLLKLNTRDERIYNRNISISLTKPVQNPTVDPAVLNALSKSTNSMQDMVDKKAFQKRDRVHTYIPNCIRHPSLSTQDQIYLAQNFSEYVLNQATQRVNWHISQFGIPKKIIALLIHYCKKIKYGE